MAQPNRTASGWLGLIALAGMWGVLIFQLGAQWSAYPQDNYGWSVPVFMLLLLWGRWQTRPEPASPRRPAWPLIMAGALALLLLPTRLMQEANPIWRLASWASAFEVLGITFCALFWVGGAAWLKHFSPPLLFFLVAVPWPSQPESAFIQALTHLNADATVEVLNLCGVPALTRGNVIEISAGLVGIDEACSGVRSFQATLMISLLLGELYRLNGRRKVALVLSGAGLAFASNLCRTFILVLICARQGVTALHRWHDPAGVTILLSCFIGLWLVAGRLRRKNVPAQPAGPAIEPAHLPQALPQWAGAGLLIWLVMIEAGTEAWFRTHETPPQNAPAWAVQWPSTRAQFEETPISGNVRGELNYDEGKAAEWLEPDGSRWQLFHFQWRRSRSLANRVRVQFARSHRPEICLPATGMVLRDDLGIRLEEINGIKLPFHDYRFEDQGTPLHVYFCIWDEATQGSVAVNMRENAGARLRAVLAGNRSLGQQVLEIAVWGIGSDEEAKEALNKLLAEIIRRQ